MHRDNTARQFHVLLVPTATTRTKPAPSQRRASGLGLVAAVLVSAGLWTGIIMLIAQAFHYFS